ncbi:hypothetical protein INT45_011539 [Circinella minor]|uniref:DNA mismatch repair protein PMS1 n=1 Tax=Circinella minor TaxID=1195481 RepID=A0A8H7VNQ4_9FUNG|nr:hypothetical protein INT45_011539 [Circinella minor]
MSSIAAIDKQTVHRICSGQVVLDLAMAVKELVENSLDAGATSIEIKFKENGAECLEVIDNGYGIAPENYEHLALKHYTSKIERFEDLESVTTFGFRGEALSSLCALSKVVVTTATKDQEPRGVKLVYDIEGHLVSQTPIARAMGTTIQLSKIFYTLPVRQQEFKRNIKREYGKAIAIVQAYGIIAKNTKLTATNQLARGHYSVNTLDRAISQVIATSGNKAVRENISNIFGIKMLSQIMLFQVDLPAINRSNQNTEEDDNAKIIGSETQPVIHGFISKPQFGYGRSSGDRQYFFINGRPCALPKLAKALNELYRSFVSNQYPFIVADIRLSPNMYDVNVTPDKRTILLHNEQNIIEYISDELREQLEPSRSTYVAEPFTSFNQQRSNQQESETTRAETTETTILEEPSASFLPISTQTTQLPTPPSSVSRSSQPRSAPISRASLSSFTYSNQRPSLSPSSGSSISSISSRKRIYNDNNNGSIMDFITKRARVTNEQRERQQRLVNRDPLLDELMCREKEDNDDELEDDDDSNDIQMTTPGVTIEADMQATEHSDNEEIHDETEEIIIQNNESLVFRNPGPWYTRGTTRSITIQPSTFENSINRQRQRRRRSSLTRANIPTSTTVKTTTDTDITMTDTLDDANLTNTDDNETATAALSRVIRKTDFSKMKVIGQFNLGFIITMLNNHDLFIVDQHASDEKYNFETLQLTTAIDGQRLIKPQNPELTAAEEIVAMENVEILRANGFELEIDPEKQPSQRIRVISQPISKNVIFDKKDFSELVYALSERPGQMVRCSRARAMFASRACRSSVMIGHCLNMRKMCQIVQHMGEIDQPWNCPHGRPTMRHLCSIEHTTTKIPSS